MIVETTSGKVRGLLGDRITVYKDVPYAQPPVGNLRFRSPKPASPWSGVRGAEQFGPAPIQTIEGFTSWIYTTPQETDEDCLSLNIWAPNDGKNRAVIVWIYGSGFRTGASSLPLFDGTRFADPGGVVFVSINHRNGAFGWIAHPDLRDPETGACGNWGLQDQALALRWVRENIEAFGGNPEKVTLMGQSAGAISTVMLGQAATTWSLFDQMILLSAPYLACPPMPDIDDAAAYAEKLAKRLGVTVTELRKARALDLHNIELEQSNLIAAETGRAFRGPVPDGGILEVWPSLRDLPDIPALIGYTRTEGSFWTDLIDSQTNQRFTPKLDDDKAIANAISMHLNAVYGPKPGAPSSEAVIEHYRKAARAEGREDSFGDILTEIFGDASLRHYGVRAAERQARNGNNQVYCFDYALPLLPPGRGTLHCAEIPILFGTFEHPHYRAKVEAVQRPLSAAMLKSFTSFAKSGVPSAEELPAWPAFDCERPSVMAFGEGGNLGKTNYISKYEQLAILDSLALGVG